MHGIERPFFCRDLLDLFVNPALQRHQNGVELARQITDYPDIVLQSLEYLISLAVTEHERLHQDKPAVAALLRLREQPSVCRFIFSGIYSGGLSLGLSILPPYIVYADEYAQDIRLVLDAVHFPAGRQVPDGIAVDTRVYNTDIEVGVPRQKHIAHKVHVAEAEGPVSWVVPVRIGYAVADEDNGLIGL